MRLEIWLGERLVGWLGIDAESRFTFIYSPEWLRWNEHFPLSPQLPLTDAAPNPERHSAYVRHFFDNLLPEGRALDEASQAYQVSRGNVAALLAALGRETAGAFRIKLERAVAAGDIADDRHGQHDHNSSDADDDRSQPARELSFEELSQRIRARPYTPFSVWDGRVRLSIAGLQDKLAVTEHKGRWYLPDGRASSTHILKPDMAGHADARLTSNEFFCMRLARRAGLPVATVRLAHVPEAVLVVERFDRRVDATGVLRVHVIDGCQALGLPSSHKYERQFGSGRDVAHLRDGASLGRLFNLLRPHQVAMPAVERQRLLRWALFQVLIGNTDAHAKNLSFFSSAAGLSIAPAYDLVSVSAMPVEGMDNSYAMAIGDAFHYEDLNAEEWVDMALACGLPARLVATELAALTARVDAALPDTVSEALQERALPDGVERVRALIAKQCEEMAAMSRGIRRPALGKGA